jgi:hypothetical protein
MVKYCLMAFALLASASPTLAGSLVTTSGCKFSGYYGYTNCHATWTYIPDPVRDLERERQDAAARLEEDTKWEGFCKPKFWTDAYGVRRASYTRRGCEFGRSE